MYHIIRFLLIKEDLYIKSYLSGSKIGIGIGIGINAFIRVGFIRSGRIQGLMKVSL